jgi:hypothetical protein
LEDCLLCPILNNNPFVQSKSLCARDLDNSNTSDAFLWYLFLMCKKVYRWTWHYTLIQLQIKKQRFLFWPLCCLSFFDLRILITPFGIFKVFLQFLYSNWLSTKVNCIMLSRLFYCQQPYNMLHLLNKKASVSSDILVGHVTGSQNESGLSKYLMVHK